MVVLFFNKQEETTGPSQPQDPLNEQQELESQSIEPQYLEELILDGTETYEEIIESLDSPSKLLSFVNSYIEIENQLGFEAVGSGQLIEERKGQLQDVAVFLAHMLKVNGYESVVIKYNYEQNNETETRIIVPFRDTDLPRYIFFTEQGKVNAVHHGWSFNEMFRKEEERLNISVANYSIHRPGVYDLTPKEFFNR